jgi:large subunit ribosomal protein L6
MSRIGKAAVFLDDKTTVAAASNKIIIKGAKGSVEVPLPESVKLEQAEKRVKLLTAMSDKDSKSMYGLTRALLQNAVVGVREGFTKTLELHGVGYRASVSGKKLDLSLGYSHQIDFTIPEGIEVKVDKQTIIHVSGVSKELVGQVAAKIRSYRPPEPYLGKGVRYQNEKIRRKAGKSATK